MWLPQNQMILVGEVEFRGRVDGLTIKDRWFLRMVPQAFSFGCRNHFVENQEHTTCVSVNMDYMGCFPFEVEQFNLLNCTVTFEGFIDMSRFCWRIAKLIRKKFYVFSSIWTVSQNELFILRNSPFATVKSHWIKCRKPLYPGCSLCFIQLGLFFGGLLMPDW